MCRSMCTVGPTIYTVPTIRSLPSGVIKLPVLVHYLHLFHCTFCLYSVRGSLPTYNLHSRDKKGSVDRGLHTRFQHGTHEVHAQGHSNGDELSEALRRCYTPGRSRPGYSGLGLGLVIVVAAVVVAAFAALAAAASQRTSNTEFFLQVL